MRNLKIGGFILLVSCFFGALDCLAQNSEYSEAKRVEEEMIQYISKKRSAARLSSWIGVSSGYDTNVNLASTKKGDSFEKFSYLLNYFKPWRNGYRLRLSYYLDGINYSDITDSSNILNHLRLGFSKSMRRFEIGVGYGFGAFTYPRNNSSDFYLQAPSVFIRNFLTRKISQTVLLEYGVRNYARRKALADTVVTYQDKKRLDKRPRAEYRISLLATRKLLLELGGGIAVNDSNARYQDFYDYKSYDALQNIRYMILKKVELFSSFKYTRKNYDKRKVTFGDYKQQDNFYSGTVGARFALTDAGILSLYYTCRNNSSNDYYEEFTEGVFNCDWQYRF